MKPENNLEMGVEKVFCFKFMATFILLIPGTYTLM